MTDAAQEKFPKRRFRIAFNVSCDLDKCSPQNQCKVCAEFEKTVAPAFVSILEFATSLAGQHVTVHPKTFKGWPEKDTAQGKGNK